MSKVKKEGKPPLCACGCGQHVTRHTQINKWNKFLVGHHRQGKSFVDIDKIMAETPPLCACGCGQSVIFYILQKRWNKFVNGHQNRGRKPSEKRCKAASDRMKGEKNINFNKKYAEEKIKVAPLCQCGCGQYVKWDKWENKWNKYICYHQNKGNQHYKGHKHTEEVRKAQSKQMLNGQAAYMNSFIKNPSGPQIELYKLIKLLYPTAILNYPSLNRSIDIAIPNKMIAIEYDGSHWHQDQEADDRRQGQLELIGWQFLRYRDYVPPIEELKLDLKQVMAQ